MGKNALDTFAQGRVRHHRKSSASPGITKASGKKPHFEKRPKAPDHSLHWSECPQCHYRGEFVSARHELMLCTRCVCLLIPHPYAHTEEWQAITFGDTKHSRRVRG